MQIKIENFGPIKSFDFDLDKDFHVIYGKNNIGKSYAMSVVYIVLKVILDSKIDINFGLQNLAESNLIEADSIENLRQVLSKNSNHESIDIKPIFQGIFEKTISYFFLPKLRKSFKNSFSKADNVQNRLISDKFKITLIFKRLTLVFALDKTNDLSIDNIIFNKKVNVSFSNTDNEIGEGIQMMYKGSGDQIMFYVKRNTIEDMRRQLQQNLLVSCINDLNLCYLEASTHVNSIFFLPASRSGLYEGMNVFSSVFAKLSQSRNALNEKIDIPSLSEPTSDYFLNLSTIDSSVKKDIYSEFASEIEKDILDAEIVFNDENKKLEYFNQKLKLRLDLSETSSMVSEVAPIVAHLKYIINTNENTNRRKVPPSKIIFIEEPEAHLHPEIQVKLMDIFTRLINHNIKIVLTTHSNYIFNKVNNLILTNELNTEKIANYHIVQTNEGSIVKNEENLTDAGITDENFSDIAQQLYNERLETLNQD